jgi:predicted nucleotidyltransferase
MDGGWRLGAHPTGGRASKQGAAGGRNKERIFFFEKKKQKTFALGGRARNSEFCRNRFEKCYIAVMDHDAVLACLRAHEAELKQMGVLSLYLFGSTVRGEAGPDSDVDLFFEYERGNFGLFDLMGVRERTSEILGRKADMMTRNSIHKYLRARIEAEAVPVF